jgi:hypothetical protein
MESTKTKSPPTNPRNKGKHVTKKWRMPKCHVHPDHLSIVTSRSQTSPPLAAETEQCQHRHARSDATLTIQPQTRCTVVGHASQYNTHERIKSIKVTQRRVETIAQHGNTVGARPRKAVFQIVSWNCQTHTRLSLQVLDAMTLYLYSDTQKTSRSDSATDKRNARERM